MLLSLIFAFNLSVHAEVDSTDEVTLADEALHTPAMDIEGQYHVKEEVKAPAVVVKEEEKPIPAPKARKFSQADKLKMYREKLEERNRIMLEKKMEQIRYQQELALARKLEQSMNQTLKAIDNIKN